MAFDVRCTACAAKLRLAEAPPSGAMIECPKCGSQFAAPKVSEKSAKPAAVKTKSNRSRKGDEDEEPEVGKKKKEKRRKPGAKTPPAVIYLSVFGGLAGLLIFGLLVMWVLNRAGRVQELLYCIPEKYNSIRGINFATLDKLPGYKKQADKYYTAEVDLMVKKIAEAEEQDPKGYLEYMVIARSEGVDVRRFYVLRFSKPFKEDYLSGIAGVTQATVSDTTCKLMPALPKCLLDQALVYKVGKQTLVVSPNGTGYREAAMKDALAALNNHDESFGGNMDAAATLAVRGTMWMVIHRRGMLETYPFDLVKAAETDFRPLAAALQKTKTISWWLSYSGNVRVGAAVQCESSEEASKVVKDLREGRYGQADDSRASSQFKRLDMMFTQETLWGEMMQYISFQTKSGCAYLTSKVSAEKSDFMQNALNMPTAGNHDNRKQ